MEKAHLCRAQCAVKSFGCEQHTHGKAMALSALAKNKKEIELRKMATAGVEKR
jgi:hypothetical protein